MNEDNNGNNIENEFEKKGLINYLGAIIGGIVALVLCFTQFYRFLLNIVIVFGGMFIGNYVQKNRTRCPAGASCENRKDCCRLVAAFYPS